MTEPRDKLPEAGLHSAPRAGRGTAAAPRAEIAAAAVAAVWLAAVAGWAWLSPDGLGGGAVAGALAVAVPLALLGMAVATARQMRALREEAARLQATVDAMRRACLPAGQAGAAAARPAVEKRIEEIAAAQRRTEAALAMFVSRREGAPGVPSAERRAPPALPAAEPAAEQPALALGTPAEDLRAPLAIADFVRALNFPDDAEDRDGFRALRLALEDRRAARLIRAAQDVLTLLAQEGIYMDDLRPDSARPELWRRLARGERGRGIDGLGGIRDRAALALTTARMREDPVFRDAAHHFLRSFDHTFQRFESDASDAELAELADTRTARAFMLFGRAAGMFD